MILNKPDFINSKRYQNSLAVLMERYPDGTCPDHVIANALMIDEEQVDILYQEAVVSLRELMGVKND